jgi:hypothetical protein
VDNGTTPPAGAKASRHIVGICACYTADSFLWRESHSSPARHPDAHCLSRCLYPFLGDPDIPRGEAYAQQARVGQPVHSAYGTGTTRLESGQQGPQGVTDVGTMGTQSDRYDTSGQYGGQYGGPATDSTTGRGDPTGRGGATQDDDDDNYAPTSGSAAGKPSLGSKVKGTSFLGVVEPCWQRLT